MSKRRQVTVIRDIAYHRNGIGGVGFHAVLFDTEDGTFIASVFPEDGVVSVLQVSLLAAGDVAFGSNSWRGDLYEPELREAIANRDILGETS